MSDPDLQQLEQSDLSLLETLDHVLNRGLVVAGEIIISVADVELIFVGLNVVLGSVETIREVLGRRQAATEVIPRPIEALNPPAAETEEA